LGVFQTLFADASKSVSVRFLSVKEDLNSEYQRYKIQESKTKYADSCEIILAKSYQKIGVRMYLGACLRELLRASASVFYRLKRTKK
jgi:hypothetical protein